MSSSPPTKYQPQAIEAAMQARWSATRAYEVTENDPRYPKGKYYACSMLPYPSGRLHMGHVRNYAINDMITRSLRMKGYNVLMPMGWDAFGLPAENAAMARNVPPAQWTRDNIAHMKQQMQTMGLAIDWSRELSTCTPEYYKWNQWLFLKMLEKGIAYRKTQIVNWDPVDMTVLANEQVIDGRGWRTGALVEKREIPGYYLKITDFAESLNHTVKHALEGWPERVKLMQENWIGKSEGVRLAFPHQITDASGQLVQGGKMHAFTTRADTLLGVSFVAVAPEHPLAVRAAELKPELAAPIDALKLGGTTEAELAQKEKEGLPTGLFVAHPLSGEPIEIWVANYVLITYGDGAVMGVPAHDERDFAFAKKYGIAIKQVVAVADHSYSTDAWQEWYGVKGDGTAVNSGKYDGLAFKACVDAIVTDLAALGLGEKKTTWRLRDWGVSRQRYWGTPVPIIHCPEHGAVPVPERDLPVILPEDCVPDGSGNPLNKHTAFHAGVTCPTCGKASRRETDTLDTFVDSAWYYMRYCDAKLDDAMVGAGADYWMPMDQYIGGIEHAILHLLYARFWTRVMKDLGLAKVEEPFTKLLCQGMVLNHIYSRRTQAGGKEYFWPHDVENLADESGKITGAKLKSDGSAITYEGVGTMSKSKNNGVDPQVLVDKYGADTARLYTLFTAPPEATLEWNDSAVEGSARFLRRVWVYASAQEGVATRYAALSTTDFSQASKAAKALRFEVHTVLKQISFDYERLQFNTVVSGCMKLLNALEAFKPTSADEALAATEALSILLRTLYPACPHLCTSLWLELKLDGVAGDMLNAAWPLVDARALQQDEIELMLQINGKLRGSISVSADADKASIEAAARAHEAFVKLGAEAKKIVVVPGRLVNIVA